MNWIAPDPQYFNEYQIEALKLSKQANYLHLPVQSGDNEILRKMNRKYTREQYINLIEKIRSACPGIAIGTDIIVGFCGETDRQFQNTVDLYKQCDFDIAFLAMYSERSGTTVAKAVKAVTYERRKKGEVSPYDDTVSQEIKKQRWDELQVLMEETTFKKNQKYLGQVVEVLVEKCEPIVIPGLTKDPVFAKDGKPSSGLEAPPGRWPVAPLGKGGGQLVCSGNSGEMKLTQFLGKPDLIGKIIKVKISQPLMWLLKGDMV